MSVAAAYFFGDDKSSDSKHAVSRWNSKYPGEISFRVDGGGSSSLSRQSSLEREQSACLRVLLGLRGVIKSLCNDELSRWSVSTLSESSKD